MKPHLPVVLRKVVLACAAAVVSLTTTVGAAVFAGGAASFTLAGVAMAADATSESGNQTLNYSGGDFTWNATTEAFSNGDETVAFTQGDSVIFNGTSTIKFGEQLTAQCVTIAGGADVTISGDGAGSLALETAEVYGTLKLSKGGENGSFSGDVDVYGTLDFAAGDVTGWSNSLGIKSIDVFEGGRVHVSVGVSGWSNNQTGAGLAINLMGGSITGVSNANLDLGYGGSTYGYSSISARAAADATAANPTVSTVSGTNLTLRQNATTISVAENARLDISSGILIASGKALLNSEGSVPAGITAGLTKIGVGELRLSGNNTYTQATTVAEGTLTLTGGAALVSSSVTVNSGAVFKLDTAADTSINYANQISGSGLLLKTGAGSASIGGLADSFAGHIDLQQGTLSVGSPVVISSGRELSLGMTGAALDSSLSLGDGKLSIDYSGSGASTSLNNSALTLLGGTQLQLSNLTGGDGKTYELFAGIGSLLGRDGNALVLDDTNNAISNYFDSTRPGSGFWAGATLQLTDAGTLQLVLHNETVKEAITITSRQTNPSAYQYYAGIAFEDISNDSDSSAEGGAIYGSTITLSDNGSVSFSGNTASSSDVLAYGGAIYGYGDITLSDNGSVTFSGNTASSGGAIYGDEDITLSNNGSVTFSGNTASSSSSSARGGAIYASGDLSIRNNESVLFEKNVEKSGSSYRLRSIYAGGIGDAISLSAAVGKSIEFRDSVYIASGSTVNLNADYTYLDEAGESVTIRQTGDIIFTGADTEQHLNDLLEAAGAGRTATAQEILNSRTTEVCAMTNLYGGRLRVEEGAIYQGQGITAMEGSAATVRVQNATLSHSGYDLTFNAGTTLELAGANSISGNLNLLDGSTLHIDFAGNEFATNLDGSPLALTGDAFLRLTGAGNGDGKTYTLLTGVSGLLDAQGNAISLDDTNNAISNYFDSTRPGTGFWADGTLHLTNAGTLQLVLHNETVKEAITITSRQTNPSAYQYYAGIAFEDISNDSDSSARGGAIDGALNSTITLSDNGSVTFSGNTASSSSNFASGGAIFGDGGSITLSNNGSVSFSGNTASSSDSSADGGAICGFNGSTITLNDNGSVTFTGNMASYGGAIYGSTITLSDNGSVSFSGNTVSSFVSYALGGAIYGYSTITLSNNGSVTFSGNTASSSSNFARGGAIAGSVTMTGNGDVSFSGNTASSSSNFASGGAIDGDVTMTGNGDVSFSGNTASSSSNFASGGAIAGSAITLSNNGSVTFSGNTASSTSFAAFGGAIYGSWDRTITLSNNGSVSFSGNTASHVGGAIAGSVTMTGNGDVSFSGNTAFSEDSAAYGGAISGDVTMEGNGSVTFSGNTASASSSSAADGGAISGSAITLSNNGSVTFIGNTASGSPFAASGGAIYTYGDLSIRNNDSVEFYLNAEVENGTYRLRSIYAYDGNGGEIEISLSASAGKSITFRDSVYIASGSTVNLNADYTYQDAEGVSVTVKQKGDIIFTGADTEQHLNNLLEAAGAGRTATAQEILNSRTTEVSAMTNLYGGRLRVEEGAIYQGQGITAMEGSAATVRVQNATLSQVGYDLTFNAGTSLEVAGNSTIRGNVSLLADSLFKLEQAATLSLHETLQADAAELTVQGTALLAGSSTLNASLTLADGATLDMMSLDAGAVTINGALTFGGKVEMGTNLLAAVEGLTCWDPGMVLFTGLTDLTLPVAVVGLESSRVLANSVFSNVQSESLFVEYRVEDNVGSLLVLNVPEPATSTLSLLALAALVARRRRK